ncbi:MAG: hypothetical protein ACKVP5_01850 [Aestuariivirga sp.]
MAKKSSSTRRKSPVRANTFVVSLGPPKSLPAFAPKSMTEGPPRDFQAMQDAIGEKRKPQGPQKFVLKKTAGRVKVSKVPSTDPE